MLVMLFRKLDMLNMIRRSTDKSTINNVISISNICIYLCILNYLYKINKNLQFKPLITSLIKSNIRDFFLTWLCFGYEALSTVDSVSEGVFLSFLNR